MPLTGGIALGVAPDLPYDKRAMILSPGDTLVLYTDGVTEAENNASEQFGIDRLREVFAGLPPRDAHDITTAVFQAVKSFAADAPQFDDITCLTLHRCGGDI